MGIAPGSVVVLFTVATAFLLLVVLAEGQSPSPEARPSPPKGASSAEKPARAKPNDVRPILTFEEGRLTVQVQNRLLDSILDEISRQGRVAIVKAAGVGSERVSVQLKDVALDDGLRQILKDHDTFFFYSVEKKGPASLRAVWVYPKGRGRGLAPVPPEAWASTKEMRQEAKSNPDPAARARAVDVLVERSGDQALDVVLGALRDADDGVRTQALYGALNAGVRLPADSLVHLALADPSPNVRFLALQSLAADPDARARIDVGAIATQALSDPSPHVRMKAQEILQRLNPAPRRQPSDQSQFQPRSP